MNTRNDYIPRWAERVAPEEATPFGADERTALSLMFGMPDPTLFPAEELGAAAVRVLGNRDEAPLALQYGTVQGQPGMISLLIEKLRHAEGLELAPENVLITNGALAAVALATRGFVDEGDTVLVEAPTFPGAVSVFQRARARLCPLPMGMHGIDVTATEALLDSLHVRGVYPRLLYTMPTFHNPTGLTLPEDLRGALLALARRYNLVVIEDDAYRDLYYDTSDGPPPSSLYALDSEGRVVRAGTFSKILAPGVRLGWALARPDIVRKMLLLKEEGGTNPLAQHIAIEYSKDGALAAHIIELVAAYRAKRDAMLSALARYMPEEATWTRPAGGFFVWLTLPASIDPVQLFARAREEGVDYMPGERCFVDAPPRPGTYLRLSFSTLNLDELEEAVKRLARAVRTLM